MFRHKYIKEEHWGRYAEKSEQLKRGAFLLGSILLGILSIVWGYYMVSSVALKYLSYVSGAFAILSALWGARQYHVLTRYEPSLLLTNPPPTYTHTDGDTPASQALLADEQERAERRRSWNLLTTEQKREQAKQNREDIVARANKTNMAQIEKEASAKAAQRAAALDTPDLDEESEDEARAVEEAERMQRHKVELANLRKLHLERVEARRKRLERIR